MQAHKLTLNEQQERNKTGKTCVYGVINNVNRILSQIKKLKVLSMKNIKLALRLTKRIFAEQTKNHKKTERKRK